mmetsp:Transcript_8308/g.14896  ORF Transcript_8308/g.14896 Transcript_8308/m.14896 type:complete len:209 (+) Transcript_8308:127-753(+)
MTLDLQPSLDCAFRKASMATLSGTPSTSNSILFGRIAATQYSIAPFPAPIRLSATRLVMAFLGKMVIQTLPFLSIVRTMTRRMLSICLEEIHASSRPTRAYLPKFGTVPLVAKPRNFHLLEPWKGLTIGLCGFLYLMFLGISMCMPTAGARGLPVSGKPSLSSECVFRTMWEAPVKPTKACMHEAIKLIKTTPTATVKPDRPDRYPVI